jgi:hypothetical protein
MKKSEAESRSFTHPKTGRRWTFPKDSGRFLGIHSRMKNPPACEYGHFGCSIWEGGPCLNEFAPLEEEL